MKKKKSKVLRKSFVIGMVMMLIVISFFTVPQTTKNARAANVPEPTIQILTNQYVEDSSEANYHQYFTILWSNLNLSFRVASLSHSGTWNAPGTSSKPWAMNWNNDSRTLTLTYGNTTSNIAVDIHFDVSVSADGFDTLLMNATANTNDENAFNVTIMNLYTGINSHIDRKIYDVARSTLDYYYKLTWGVPTSIIPYEDGRFLVVSKTSGSLADEGYPGVSTSATDVPVLYFTNADKSSHAKDHNELHSMFKVVTPQQKRMGPKVLMLNPFSDVSRWKEFDNETIYKVAAQEYHITHLIIWDMWFKTPSYDWYNNTVRDEILDIVSYAHKYNIKVGFYFGWRDFTTYGAYNPLYEFNTSSLSAAQESWETWKAKYYNISDFIAWDYGSTSVTSTSKTWSYWNYYYINQIWKTIDKPIIYNAGMTGLWYGDNFIPMRFEDGVSFTWFAEHFTHNETWNGLFHNFGYPQVWFEKSLYSSNVWNETRGEEMNSIFAEFGIMPMPLFGYQNTHDFSENIGDFKDWKGYMTVYDFPAGIGYQEENKTDIILLLNTNSVSYNIQVEPHQRNPIPIHIFTNKSAKIEYMINDTSHIVVKDITNGETVPWTKGSVIFNATAGHTYEIYDAQQKMIEETYGGVNIMITIMVLMMLVSAVGTITKVRK